MLRSKELNKATVETNNNCKFCSLDVLAGLGVKNQIFGLLKYHVDLRTIYEHMSFKQLFTQPAKPTHRTARNDNGRGHTVRRSKYVPFSMVFFSDIVVCIGYCFRSRFSINQRSMAVSGR